MDGMVGFWLFGAFLFFVAVVLPIRASYKRWRATQDSAELSAKNEALFRSMFPELQPYFHPERLVEFVMARKRRSGSGKQVRWTKPAGFPAAAFADLEAGERDRERVRLLDTAGAPLLEFTFEKHPEGAVLRYGKGKFTVDVRKPPQPRVRYWHPDREFKWSRAGWIFKTPVADEPFESSSSSSSFTNSSDSSRPAAAAGIVGHGGTFDGGGASSGWDGPTPGAVSSAALGAGLIGGAVGESLSDTSQSTGSTAY
jgi:uncharacterized membrane protein YgcG